MDCPYTGNPCNPRSLGSLWSDILGMCDACKCQNPDRMLRVQQDRFNLPFPAVQGTALLLKARFLLSGMGRCVKFFSLREGFFFALLLIFPFRQEKNGAQTRIKEACHKIYIAIRRSGEFLTGRSEKKHDLWPHEAKKSPATSRIGGCPKRPLPQRQTA